MIRPLSPRFLASPVLRLLGGLLLLAVVSHAQVPGEVLRAVRIPGTGGGDPVLRAGDGFGRSVANAGDIDGDGTPDLLVGAANDDTGSQPGQVVTNAGAAYLIFLNPDGTARQSVKYSNASGNLPFLEEDDYFGKGVSPLGDLDGDGVLDVVVSAPGDDDGVDRHGAVYILFLNADGTIKNHQKISATDGGFVTLEERSEWGRGIAPLGDLDGDGVLDLAVSRMRRKSSLTFEGTVYVLFLKPDGTVRDFQTITLTDLGLFYGKGFFGFHLSSSDLDDDGVLDLVVGDIGYDGRNSDGALNPQIGAVWFITLNPDGTPKTGWMISQFVNGFDEPLDPGDHFGAAASYPHLDFDGDGVDDLVVGRKRDDDDHSGSCDSGGTHCSDYYTCCYDPGAFYILFMHPDWTVKGWQKISNLHGRFPWHLNQDDRLGQCLTSLGDLDGDGFPEVAVSARWDDDAAPNAGIVYVCTISDGSLTPTVAWFRANPTQGSAPLTVAFIDASIGVDLDSWAWDFGDGGTSSLQHPTHVYTSPGTYTVILDADGLSGHDRATRTGLIIVEDGTLDVDFTASPRVGEAPLAVTFTDLTTGGPATWAWDFGDGQSSTLQHPVHSYLADGTYTVSLTVDGGAAMMVKNDYIVVATAGVTADFDATPRSGSAPLDVVFTDRSLGDPVSWAWDFGDGQSSTLQNPTHAYVEDGTYTVSLTAVDIGDESDTVIKEGYIRVGGDFLRFGCDPNAANTLTIESGVPQIGTTVVFGIDNPYGTQPSGSSTWLRVAFAPDAAYPCGVWRPNYGMAYAGADGEILLSLSPKPFTFPGSPFGGPGVPGLAAVPIPNNVALVGRAVYGQGVIFDPAGTLGVPYAVTDGLEFVIR